MTTDTELKIKGMGALSAALGQVEAERFIALILREPFDYTKWRRDLPQDECVQKLSAKAMELRRQERDRP